MSDPAIAWNSRLVQCVLDNYISKLRFVRKRTLTTLPRTKLSPRARGFGLHFGIYKRIADREKSRRERFVRTNLRAESAVRLMVSPSETIVFNPSPRIRSLFLKYGFSGNGTGFARITTRLDSAIGYGSSDLRRTAKWLTRTRIHRPRRVSHIRLCEPPLGRSYPGSVVSTAIHPTGDAPGADRHGRASVTARETGEEP